MGSAEPAQLLALASQAARAAGELLRERFEAGGKLGVSAKSSPTDLVSEADLASQQVIRELIGAARPDDGFLGEEEGADDAGTSGLQWVVDPLDGTINFVFGIPLWCVSIAVRDARGLDRRRDPLPACRRDVHGDPRRRPAAAGRLRDRAGEAPRRVAQRGPRRDRVRLRLRRARARRPR